MIKKKLSILATMLIVMSLLTISVYADTTGEEESTERNQSAVTVEDEVIIPLESDENVVNSNDGVALNDPSKIISVKGSTVPIMTYNLTKGSYSVRGQANNSALYSDHFLTGKSMFNMKITNNHSEPLRIVLRNRQGVVLVRHTTPANCYNVWTFNGLSANLSYYVEFGAPSNFSGTIS